MSVSFIYSSDRIFYFHFISFKISFIYFFLSLFFTIYKKLQKRIYIYIYLSTKHGNQVGYNFFVKWICIYCPSWYGSILVVCIQGNPLNCFFIIIPLLLLYTCCTNCSVCVCVCQLFIQSMRVQHLNPPPSLIKESGQGVAMETQLYNSCHSNQKNSWAVVVVKATVKRVRKRGTEAPGKHAGKQAEGLSWEPPCVLHPVSIEQIKRPHPTLSKLPKLSQYRKLLISSTSRCQMEVFLIW